MKVVRPNPNNKDLGAILDGRMRKVGPEKIQKPKTQMNANLREMARSSFGYGGWDAKYWFIGPEQGIGAEDLLTRVRAWTELGGRDLNDCREFHCRINETRWHCKKPKVDLQSTWRRLMLLMMAFLGRPVDRESLRNYQRDQWGRSGGETCVIELSGLAAPNLEEAEDTSLFLQTRIEVIRGKIADHKPRLVIMYGDMQRDSWEAIVSPLCFRDDKVLVSGSTIFAHTPHPNKRGLLDSYWTDLGRRLRGL